MALDCSDLNRQQSPSIQEQFPEVSAAKRMKYRVMGRSSSLKYSGGEQGLSYRPPLQKTEEEKRLIAEILRTNPNLKKIAPLNESQIQQLVEVAWKEKVPKGQVLMTEGDLNNATFYIVARGSFDIVACEPFEVVELEGWSYLSRPEQPPAPQLDNDVVKKPKTERKLYKNSMVGDSSMYYGTPRWASVTAQEDSEVWTISQANFKTCQMQAADGLPSAKTEEDAKLIKAVLAANQNINNLTQLGAQHLQTLAQLAWKIGIEKDEVFMKEGDLNADAFYIVAEGSLEFTGSEPFQQVVSDGVSYLSRAAHTGEALDAPVRPHEKTQRLFERGLCFGEISMLYCAPRFATVVAKEPSSVWAIDRASFQMVQMKAAEDEIKKRVKYLNDLEELQSFSMDDKEKLSGAMETMRLTKGETIVQQNVLGTTLYIVVQGSLTAEAPGLRKQLEADLATGAVHYFGVNALMGSRLPSTETVTVASSNALALTMERDEFNKIWDRILEARPSEAFTRYATSVTKVRSETGAVFAFETQQKISLIGCGAFGPVELCQNKTNKELYVMKTLSKGLVVQRGLRASILKERMLWVGLASPFIVRVFATYNQPQHLCFLVEAALGGELSRTYERHNLWGSVKHAMYYVAGVVLALEHLHKRRIVYRNVQPQNVLLSQLGHPKLTDMALAKLVVGHTFTVCGTPSYMAPEVIAGVGHTRGADWWSVGVLAFELMSGSAPFESDHPMEIYSKVMRGFARVQRPQALEGAVGDLVGSLLQPKAIDRLAMRQGGVKNVLDHQWFASFDWFAMRSLTLEAPYKPAWPTPPSEWKDLSPSQSGLYLTHYLPLSIGVPPEPVEYVDDGSGWDEEFETISQE